MREDVIPVLVKIRRLSLAVLFSGLLFLAFSMTVPVTSYAAEFDVDSRFQEIAQKYEEGEVLSAEDAEFVEANAEKLASVRELAIAPLSGSINKSFTQYGVTAVLSGNIWHEGVLTYSWGGNLTGTITIGSTPQSMRVYATVMAFGVGGDGSVSLGYSNTLSNTSSNSKSVSMNKSGSYSGVFVFYYVVGGLEVNTSSGSFSFEGE